MAPLTFVRPGELRHAEWEEINSTDMVWKIPAEKMKMRSVHIVPLAEQAVAVLREIRPLTGIGGLVFELPIMCDKRTKPVSCKIFGVG